MNKEFKRDRKSSKSRNHGTSKSPHQRRNNRSRQSQRRKPSSLNPELLIQRSTDTVVKAYESQRTIEDLPIDAGIIQRLLKKGYARPTQIQDRTLEPLLEGRDILGIAQTGTGKTGAFLVPIIQQLIERPTNKPYALVLLPTRELAVQVEQEFKSMTHGMKLYSACFIGGTNINKDLQTLRRHSQVVIATPGRLLDLVQRKMLDLRHFQTLVLDEFDRMLDMGFERDVQRIIKSMGQRQQTMLFSATLDRTQESLIADILHQPVEVHVSDGKASAERVDQDIIRLNPGEDKLEVLQALIAERQEEKVLIFEETKRKVSKLCKQLNQRGIRSEEIHGNKSQSARQKALGSFKTGTVKVLIATDVAARGIDVNDIELVVNYDLPRTMDSYIHRIGRTGRAGKKGTALTFVA